MTMRVGLIIPSSNRMVEQEMVPAYPEGVCAHVTRLRMTGAEVRSAFVAAAFALHPLHVESVAWISERKDVLSTLFWLLTMLAYVNYVHRGRAWRPLADTATAAQILYGARDDWDSWRRDVDFYLEGDLLWLEVDATIRETTKGARSLDDFCRSFFGGKSGMPAPPTWSSCSACSINSRSISCTSKRAPSPCGYVTHNSPPRCSWKSRSPWKTSAVSKSSVGSAPPSTASP